MRKDERDMLLNKIEEWKLKAQSEPDPFNKYISIFISFNILYNLYKKTENPRADLTVDDRKRATEILFLLDTEILYQVIRPCLKEYLNLIPIYKDEYWNRKDSTPINRVLGEAFARRDTKKTMEMLLKWLYKVRCNLVHGEKDYNDQRQKQMLAMSSTLMEKILDHALESYRNLYVSGAKASVFQ